MASASAIEVRIGRGDPSAMSLNPGTVLDPTSIGKSGMWRVDGPGVLDVHGYIYYDGKALYVQSADDKTPLMVNKHRVSTAWTEVKAGSTIEVGRAELFYRAGASAADADATIARPMTGMPGQHDDGDPDSTNPKRPSNPTMMGPEGGPKAGPLFRPGAGTFANRADDESTRLRPMDEAPGGNVSQAPRPAAGAPMARPNIQRPMMDAQESTVIAPIEDLSGGRSPGGPRPGIGAMGGGPAMGMGGPGMGQPMGGPQMGMGGPGQMGMAGGPGMGQRPGMPGQMGGMPGQMGGMPGQMGGGMPGQAMPGQMGGMPGQMGGGMPGQGMPGQPWGMPGGNPNATVPAQNAIAQSPIDKFKADWAGFPPGKRAIYIGCPFLMVAALIFLFSDTPADAGKTAPVPSSSAQTAAGGTAGGGLGANPLAGSTAGGGMQNGMQGSTVPAGFQGGSLQPTPSTAAAANVFGNPPPTPSASVSATASGRAGSKPPPTTAAIGDAGALEGMGVEPKNKTNERKAADAWAEGNYELAAQMYDELAREQPGNPAFPAAAAILREKLDGGIH